MEKKMETFQPYLITWGIPLGTWEDFPCHELLWFGPFSVGLESFQVEFQQALNAPLKQKAQNCLWLMWISWSENAWKHQQVLYCTDWFCFIMFYLYRGKIHNKWSKTIVLRIYCRHFLKPTEEILEFGARLGQDHISLGGARKGSLGSEAICVKYQPSKSEEVNQ
jgi:hypothetical protein